MTSIGNLAMPLRRTASPRGMTAYSAVAAASFFATSSAPTPLYRLYQETLQLSPLLLTVIFAVYAGCLLTALLTIGKLSDYIGRKPMILTALLLNVVALVLFIEADSAGWLIAARAVQGFASGAASTALGAAILDSDRTRGPLLNSITGFIGLTIGSLASGALVAYAPLPLQLIYILLLALSLVLALLLWRMPETTTRRPGAWASLKPVVRIPRPARRALLQVTPVNIAAWALGGFYYSLMPSVVRAATGLTSPLIGGLDIALLTVVATTMVILLRHGSTLRLLVVGTLSLAIGVAVTLAGVLLALTPLLFLGTAISGIGFGTTFSGVLRQVLPLAPPDQRAGLLAAYYAMSYLAFSLPALLAGLAVPQLGLTGTTYVYGGVVILLALLSFAALRFSRPLSTEVP